MRVRPARERLLAEHVVGWHFINRLLRRRVRFGRCRDASCSPPPPLHWSPCHPSTLWRFKATLSCPNGHLLTLRQHFIRSDGLVMPSVVCLAENCTFHAYVKLSEWTFGNIR